MTGNNLTIKAIKDGAVTVKQYNAVHKWIVAYLGRPATCENCGGTAKQWANLSGQYKRERSDWKRLCVKCHKNMDRTSNLFRNYCIHGHRLVISNLKIRLDKRRNQRYIECRQCVHASNRKALA